MQSADSGTCWVMGNLHYTFDSHYYTFMGNCTYTLAKSCDGAAVPAFQVDTENTNLQGNLPIPSVGAVIINVHGINITILRNTFGMVQVSLSVKSVQVFIVVVV